MRNVFLIAGVLATAASAAHATTIQVDNWPLVDGQCYQVWAATNANIVSINVQNFARPPASEAWIYPGPSKVNPLYPASVIFRAYGTGTHRLVIHCAGTDCSGLFLLRVTPVGAPPAC